MRRLPALGFSYPAFSRPVSQQSRYRRYAPVLLPLHVPLILLCQFTIQRADVLDWFY